MIAKLLDASAKNPVLGHDVLGVVAQPSDLYRSRLKLSLQPLDLKG
jgi:hypothetical protein